MSLIDMSEVEWNAEDLLETQPTITPFSDGDYVRWAVELFRRRYEKEQKDVKEAEAAFREACKGGTFTAAEAAAHDKALREADSRRSITRASISQLVCDAKGSIEFAKKRDEWISADRRDAYSENPNNFCNYSVMQATLEGSPEAIRDAALLEAEQEYVNDMAEIKQDAREAGERGSGSPSAKHCVVVRFEQRKAAIEEEYYSRAE